MSWLSRNNDTSPAVPAVGEPLTVERAPLPGIGTQQTFLTHAGQRIGVVLHHSGRRDLLLYSSNDPDTCAATVALAVDEADLLSELLGATRVVETVADLHQYAPGLVTEQLAVGPNSPYAGKTLGDTAIRTRTGASVVAHGRGETVVCSPAPAQELHAGDVLVVVGTADAIAAVAALLDT